MISVVGQRSLWAEITLREREREREVEIEREGLREWVRQMRVMR